MVDSQWVDTTLVPTLESYGFRCCIHWKDFLPGRVFAESIVESVYNSFKIIAVVSSHFMSSNTCDFELQHAMTRLMANRDDCLIVIKFDNAGIERLPAPILDRSYIDFTRGTDRSTWESKLAGILSKAVIEDDSCRTSTTSTTDNNNRFAEGISTASEDKDLICSCQIEWRNIYAYKYTIRDQEIIVTELTRNMEIRQSSWQLSKWTSISRDYIQQDVPVNR